MVDFDNINERAEAERKQQQEWRQKNEELILAMAEQNRISHGKAAFLQHKNILTDLVLELDDAISNLQKDLIEPLSQSADRATGEEQVALTSLQDDLQEYVRNVFYYSKIQSGFDSKNVDATLQKEREYTEGIQRYAKKINEGFDKAMLYASSDTDVFLKVQALASGIQRIFTSMTNGLLPVEYDALLSNPKPTHIDGKKAHYIDATEEYAPEVGFAAENAVRARLEGLGYNNIELKTRGMGQPLFTHDPCPEDVYQGCLGDCYFVSSLAAVAAASPEMIKDMIHLSDDGTRATVRLYNHQNEPVFVTVDAIEHVAECTNNAGEPETVEIFARGASWVKLVERAFAASMLHRSLNDKANDKGYVDRMKLEDAKLPADEKKNLPDDKLAQIAADRDCERVEANNLKGSYSHIISGENIDTLQTLFGEEASEYLKDKNLASTIYCEKGDEGKYYDETEKRKTSQDKIEEAEAVYNAKVKEYEDITSFIKNEDNPDYWAYVDKKKSDSKKLEKQLPRAKAQLDSWKEAVKLEKTIYTDKELKFFNAVKEARDKGCVMTAGSRHFKDTTGKFDVGMEEFYTKYKGLPLHHSYSVVDYREDIDTGKKYIKVRDPHNQGGRAYDKTGASYYDNDKTRAGESEVELTDFIATFHVVTKMDYGDKTIAGKNIAEGKEMKELYGDALRDLCGQLKYPGNFYGLIDRDSKFNGLKTSLNNLSNVLQKKDARKPDIENCLQEVFKEAKKFRDHCNEPEQAAKMNKLSGDKANRAANRYLLAEMIGQFEVKYNANQEAQQPERVTGNQLQKMALDVTESSPAAKKFTVRVIEARMDALKAKEQKAKDKQLNNLEKQKKDVLKACQKLQAKGPAAAAEEIERALAVMMYYDDITKDSKNLSATVLEKKLKKSVVQEEMKFSAKNMKDTIAEMIAAGKCASAADFLNKFGSANAVTAIRDHWDAKTKALMEEMNAPAQNNAAVQNPEPEQNHEPVQNSGEGPALGSL